MCQDTHSEGSRVMERNDKKRMNGNGNGTGGHTSGGGDGHDDVPLTKQGKKLCVRSELPQHLKGRSNSSKLSTNRSIRDLMSSNRVKDLTL
jgi:hypothetical protein